MLWPTGGRPVCVGLRRPSEAHDKIVITHTLAVSLNVGCSFWREDGPVVYNWCWSSLAQSFSNPVPTGLTAIFTVSNLRLLPTWRARFPYLYLQEQGDPVIPTDTGLQTFINKYMCIYIRITTEFLVTNIQKDYSYLTENILPVRNLSILLRKRVTVYCENNMKTLIQSSGSFQN
jgi:hypothetical protein